ncbi:MAG: tetratricopeptide repeat protein [Vicinamibacterales bacterium]
MPAAARLLLALVTLSSGWYAVFVSPALSGLAAPAAPAPASRPGAAAAAEAPVPTDAELDALLVHSRDAFAAEQWEEALEPTRQLVRRFPGQHVYLARLAETYRRLGRPADEAATWELFLDRAPIPADACPAIGHAYRKLGKFDKALAAFERCHEADPQNAELAFFVGLGHEWASRFDTAEDWYEKAIDLAPPHYDSEVGLARVQLHRNHLDQALGRARAVLRHVPTHVDAVLVAGLAEQRAGRRGPARSYLEKAAQMSEDYFDVQLALGVLDYSESRYHDARGRFEIASRLDASRREEVQPWLDRTANVRATP